MENSDFRLYAIGTVASDLITGNKPIKVMLHELAGYTDGAIEDKKISGSVKSSDNKVFAVNMESSGTVDAVWMNNNSNRVTAPNVRVGEKVEIWRYADVDKYYWKTMGSELDLRRLEHVKWVFVNTKGGTLQIDDSNSYSVTISTLNKMISIHTSNSDGELTTYDLNIDTKAGVVELVDGRKNSIRLESASDTLTINTNNAVNVNTVNATVKADTFTVLSKKTHINP